MIYEWNNNIVICISKLIDNKDNLVGYFIYVMNNLKRDLWRNLYKIVVKCFLWWVMG